MLQIKTPEDIDIARARGEDPAILDLVADQLRSVVAAFAEAEVLWDADEHGHFVVLQPGDDARDLTEAGLNPEDHGLLGACWEACEWHQAAHAWAVLVLYGNDNGTTFVLPDEPWLDGELRAKLNAEVMEPWQHEPAAPGERTPF